MRCPWCTVDGPPRRLHAHLAEAHASAVHTDERSGNHYYSVTCPRCDATYEHSVRKGRRDPGFLDEFDREIRMVALDMLVHHLVAEHEQDEPEGEHEHSETGA
jgi:hypothetical protein